MHKRPWSLEALIGFASVIAIGMFLGLGAVMEPAPMKGVEEIRYANAEDVEARIAETDAIPEPTTEIAQATPFAESALTPEPRPTEAEPTDTTPIEGTPEVQPLIKATIQITSPTGLSTYHVAVPAESTVEDAMQAAKEEGLRYTAKTYAGVGSYVTAINGLSEDKKAEMYWVYYINGTSATAGISTQTLQAQDAIRWNYEKSFY